MLHSLALLSSDKVKSLRPPGSNMARVIAPACPLRQARSRPFATSQSRAVRSVEAVTRSAPDGSKATLRTMSLWPESKKSSAPSSLLQMRAM